MTKAVRFHKTGGPEVLQLDDVQVAAPGQGQVRVRHTAIVVKFIDTYQRSGRNCMIVVRSDRTGSSGGTETPFGSIWYP